MNHLQPETNIIMELVRFIEDTREEDYLLCFNFSYLRSAFPEIESESSIEKNVLNAFKQSLSEKRREFKMLLEKIANITELPDRLKRTIMGFIDKLAFNDENISDYKDMKYKLNQDINHIIPKSLFLNDLFYQLELILLKSFPELEETLFNLLNIYGLEYTRNTRVKSFIPGVLIYNQYEYDKHSIKESDYPHNTIVEIKYPTIRDIKSGEIIRKAKVVVSFEY